MAPEALEANDPRAPRHEAQIRSKTYSYILAKPEGTPRANVFLVHGFPDMGWGWRNQVPHLVSKGYAVLVPDMLGYGQTDAPELLEAYSLKSMSDDIAALAVHAFGAGAQIVLGGHDWGGALVWRAALWHPEVIRAVFSICTPYAPPSATFVDLADIIAAGHMKNFGYQLQLRGPDAERELQGEERIRQFLTGMYGGRGPNKESVFSPEDGVLFENLDKVGPSPLVPPEAIDHYVREYLRHGIRGPLNWYRTRKMNFDEEQPLVEKAAASEDGVLKFEQPGLMIVATKDIVLLPSLSLGMEKYFPKGVVRREAEGSHWVHWEKPEEVSAHISNWIEETVLGGAEPAIKASL